MPDDGGPSPAELGGQALRVEAHAPGRVNVIGDHTDYNQGLALPMAIELGVTARWAPAVGDGGPSGSGRLILRSATERHTGDIASGISPGEVPTLDPGWIRYPAAVLALQAPEPGYRQTPGGRPHRRGGVLSFTSDLPSGAGLSSSAAICVSTLLAVNPSLREEPPPTTTATSVSSPASASELLAAAELCQRAEALVGSPVGLMDPLVSLVGEAHHAVLVDFSGPSWSLVTWPDRFGVLVVDSGQRRELVTSRYAARRRECDDAARRIGPLGRAEQADLRRLPAGMTLRRARHVITECRRVTGMVAALTAHDLNAAGQLMNDSHRSLADDFEASTPVVDELVAALRRKPGVSGARMTGGGFGGCVVALGEVEAIAALASSTSGALGTRRWMVHPAAGARVASVTRD